MVSENFDFFQRLPNEIVRKILGIIVEKEKSFWPVLNNLQMVSFDFKEYAKNPILYKSLILDEEKILRHRFTL